MVDSQQKFQHQNSSDNGILPQSPHEESPEPRLPQIINRASHRDLHTAIQPSQLHHSLLECPDLQNARNGLSAPQASHQMEQDRERLADAYAVALEPGLANSNAAYVATRRLLLYRKAIANCTQRQSWRCEGIDYVLYRHFVRSCRNSDSQCFASPLSTPGDSGRWTSPGAQSLLHARDSSSSSKDFQNFSGGASFNAFSSDAEYFQTHKQPGDSFVGMHCVFDQFKCSVTVVRFGHRNSELLGFGASDGRLAVCTVADPPHIIHYFKGHSKSIADFDWSLNNQYLCSASLDQSVRVWDIDKGNCIRVVYGNTEQLCVCFHPVNNNFLLVGNARKELSVINFSTGRLLHKLCLESNINSIDTDHTGNVVFAGDAQGCIHSLKINSHTGSLAHAHRCHLGLLRKSPVMNVQYRTFSLIANGPVLLASTQDGRIRFFSVSLEIHGYLTLRCSLQLTPWARKINASFCPLLSLEKGELIVSGSEDGNIYFYDFTRPKHPHVNKLQGHGAPTISVAWNYGQDLLASSDCEGTVIIWKRANA